MCAAQHLLIRARQTLTVLGFLVRALLGRLEEVVPA